MNSIRNLIPVLVVAIVFVALGFTLGETTAENQAASVAAIRKANVQPSAVASWDCINNPNKAGCKEPVVTNGDVSPVTVASWDCIKNPTSQPCKEPMVVGGTTVTAATVASWDCIKNPNSPACKEPLTTGPVVSVSWNLIPSADNKSCLIMAGNVAIGTFVGTCSSFKLAPSSPVKVTAPKPASSL